MRKRLRQHVNPLKMTSLVARESPLELPAGKEVEVELGCGDAHFLLQRAQRHPERHFVGLDIREEFLEFGREARRVADLQNVDLEYSNLIVDLPVIFHSGSIRRFFINFPDPWFKARQKSRRWFDEQSLVLLVEALALKGEILYQTDVWDLALEALGLLEGESRLQNLAGEWSFRRPAPFSAQTSRELSCLADGLQIWRMHFAKHV